MQETYGTFGELQQWASQIAQAIDQEAWKHIRGDALLPPQVIGQVLQQLEQSVGSFL